ncbi:Pikachurin [Folsomia candida]|uniref:Pikachurin n=1 Tax=Folsomia candida TaxID=158441 RepID=A0A226DZG6_FOLCA|nr:Pikachurin [Folsomia candida]
MAVSFSLKNLLVSDTLVLMPYGVQFVHHPISTRPPFPPSNKVKFVEEEGKCGSSSPCVQLCVELHDGTFECQCRPGYRLLLDGYSCVELGNATYPDDEDSDELESDVDYSLADQKSSILLKAAKSAVPVAPKIVSSTPSPPSGDGDDKNSFELEGRPLPRPAASSSYQRKKPKAYLKEGSSGAIAAAKVEAQERNKYLRKFYPIDDPRVGQVDFFGLDPDVMAKATAKGLKLTPTAFGVTKAGQKGKKDKDHFGGGERDDADEELDSDEEDFILPPRALPLKNMQGDAPSPPVISAMSSSPQSDATVQKKVAGPLPPAPGGEEQQVSSSAPPPPAGKQETAEPCPLKCNRGQCIKESLDELGFRCLCPMGTRGTFCEIGGAGDSAEFDEFLIPSDSYISWNGWNGSLDTGNVFSAHSHYTKCFENVYPTQASQPPTHLSSSRSETNPFLRHRHHVSDGDGGGGEQVELFEEGGGYNSGLFRGRSWVAFPVLHDAYMADQISLEFRPQSANGILLLTGERDDLSGDYLALFLKDGYLEFRFDCGSGSGLVRSAAPVKLEQWNKASIVRRRWDGWMQLNDGPFTQGRSKGLFSRITFRQPVYIGGQGNITFNSVSSIQSNFDDEPELASSSSSAASNLATSNEAYTTTTTPTAAGSTFTSPAGSSPSSSSSSSSPPFTEPTTTPVLSFGESEKDAEGENKYKNVKNVAADANSVSEDVSESGVVEVLKRVGGFQGCLRNLVINDRVYRFGLEPAGDSLQGFDIENCNDQGVCDLVKCQHGGQCLVQKDLVQCLCPLGFSGPMCETPLDLQIPSFNGSSYLKYGGLGLTRVLSWLELEVVIKPDAMDGLIIYNGYKTDGMGDFISLIIDQGYIESDAPIALSEWHHIHVSRTSRLISLRIDNQPPLMALTPGAFTQLSLPHNLFLGGIPDPDWLSPKVKVQGGFTGCIQKLLVINEKKSSWHFIYAVFLENNDKNHYNFQLVINEKPLRIMGSAMSGVNLENCEHPCLRNPCDHGGDCVPSLDTFKCHCPLGFRDPYCQTRMDKEDVITAPKFIGDSYLRFTNPRIIKRLSGWRLNLSFSLKTESSRGLLMWAGRKWMTSASDFISMGLRNGGLEESRHHSVNRYMEGFVGCLTDMVLGSERVALLQEASEGRNVDYCD